MKQLALTALLTLTLTGVIAQSRVHILVAIIRIVMEVIILVGMVAPIVVGTTEMLEHIITTAATSAKYK